MYLSGAISFGYPGEMHCPTYQSKCPLAKSILAKGKTIPLAYASLDYGLGDQGANHKLEL
jgi:hypothetical protein